MKTLQSIIDLIVEIYGKYGVGFYPSFFIKMTLSESWTNSTIVLMQLRKTWLTLSEWSKYNETISQECCNISFCMFVDMILGCHISNVETM